MTCNLFNKPRDVSTYVLCVKLSLIHCLNSNYYEQVGAVEGVGRKKTSHTCGGVGVEEEQPTGGVEFLLPEPPARISSVTSLPP